MSEYPRLLCYWILYVLEKLRLYPRGVIAAMETMGNCVDSVVEGAREEVFTPCWWFVGSKGEGQRGGIEHHVSGNGDALVSKHAP